MIPTLTQNINNKWDSISLTDGILCFLEKFPLEKIVFFSSFISAPIMCNDPLNLNDIFQPVLPNNFGSNSIRKSVHFERISVNGLF